MLPSSFFGEGSNLSSVFFWAVLGFPVAVAFFHLTIEHRCECWHHDLDHIPPLGGRAEEELVLDTSSKIQDHHLS